MEENKKIGSFERSTFSYKFINLLIHTFINYPYEFIDTSLDTWYYSMRAFRMKLACRKAISMFLASGKQYHVIPVKLSSMWITQFIVVRRDDIKHNKKLGIIKQQFHIEDILELAVFTTPSKMTYELFKNGIPKKTKHGLV
jgi:hypothetical protein